MSTSIGSPRFGVLMAHLQQAASHHQRGVDASSSSSSNARDPRWRPMQSSVPRSTRPLGSGICSSHLSPRVPRKAPPAAVDRLSEGTLHLSIQSPANVCSLMDAHNAARCWICLPSIQLMPAGRLQVLSPTAGSAGASRLLAASPAAGKVVQASAGDEPGSASIMGDAASPMEHTASPMDASPLDMHLDSQVRKGAPPRTSARPLPGEAVKLSQCAPPRRGLHLQDKHDAKVSPATAGTVQVCPIAQSLFSKHLYAAQNRLLTWMQLLSNCNPVNRGSIHRVTAS